MMEPDRQRNTAYLQGELPEEEASAFEREHLVEDEAFALLGACEDELIDAYVDGDLDGARRRFEERCLSDPARRERVRAAEALRRAFRPKRGRRRVLLAGVAAVLAAAAVLVWLVRPPTPPRLAAITVRLPAPVRGAAEVVALCPEGTRELRLEPMLPVTPPAGDLGARLRRVGGDAVAGRLEPGPPLAFVVDGCPPSGTYELALSQDDTPVAYFRLRIP